MQRLAKEIVITRKGSYASLTIDGEEFPFYLNRQATVNIDLDGIPSVTFTIYAEHVRVTDDFVDRAREQEDPEGG